MPRSGESIWFIIPDYDIVSSRYTHCSISGLQKRPGDVGVFRPAFEIGYIEGEGAFDIGQLAIEEAAEMIGWHRPEALDAATSELYQKLSKLGSEKGVLSKKVKKLEAEVALLTEQLEATKGVVA